MDPREYLKCSDKNCLECESYKTVDRYGMCDEVRRVILEKTEIDIGNYMKLEEK